MRELMARAAVTQGVRVMEVCAAQIGLWFLPLSRRLNHTAVAVGSAVHGPLGRGGRRANAQKSLVLRPQL